MKLRSWGAVAAAALVVAGCGSSVLGGQALPAVPLSSAAVSGPASTGVSVAPFPEPSSVSRTAAASSTAAPSSTAASTPTTGTSSSSTTPGTTASATAAPSTTVTWSLPLPKGGPGKVNRFGNVIATTGQPLAVQWTGNKQVAVVFVVDSIQVDRGCVGKVKPKNGHMLVITVRAQLGYSTGEELANKSIGFTDDQWTAFDAKDTAQVDVDTSASSACVPYDKQFPYATDLEPDKLYSGKIALDVSSATGTAVLMDSLDGGWVYHYG